ncbi:MAG: hypothetical protein JW940_33995 [Polyangiaceae bacterium]|nr:hypothetical protein [Polyangiaceae bacterium]
MKQYSIVTIAIASLATTFAVACSDKEEALAELQKVEQQCQAGNSDKAREIMFAAAEKNESFRKAYHFSTQGLPDRAYVQPCGPVLVQLKGQLND